MSCHKIEVMGVVLHTFLKTQSTRSNIKNYSFLFPGPFLGKARRNTMNMCIILF